MDNVLMCEVFDIKSISRNERALPFASDEVTYVLDMHSNARPDT